MKMRKAYLSFNEIQVSLQSGLLAFMILALIAFSGCDACSKFKKIKSGYVAVELHTPSGQPGRGIGNLKITPERIAISSNALSVCTGTVPENTYQSLIRELNKMGFIFTNSSRDKITGGQEPFSLSVTEHSEGKTRSNTVYWVGESFPHPEVLLILNRIRNAIQQSGECTGNVPIGDPCRDNNQCRSSCCKNTAPGLDTCVVSSECKPKR
jgi:hypothetical protein